MNIFIVFLAIAIAVIIFSIALQKIFRCPILVAAIIFAVLLVATVIIGDINYLIATIIYTVLAFFTAWFTCLINRLCRRISNENNNNDNSNCGCGCNNNNSSNNSNSGDDVATQSDINNILRAINALNNNNTNCCCRRRF